MSWQTHYYEYGKGGDEELHNFMEVLTMLEEESDQTIRFDALLSGLPVEFVNVFTESLELLEDEGAEGLRFQNLDGVNEYRFKGKNAYFAQGDTGAYVLEEDEIVSNRYRSIRSYADFTVP